MHELESARYQLRLVALQMPNQMPPNPKSRIPGLESRLFLQSFLHPILADVEQSRSNSRANRIHTQTLCDGDDRNRLRRTPRDFPPHLGQTLREGLETHSRGI